MIGVLRSFIAGRAAVLLPVVADETTDLNAIPDAMAQVLGCDLDLPIMAGEIVQTDKVGTLALPRSSGW